MRAIVTGGAGFIGSHLVDLLAGRGDDVLVVDDLSTGRADRLRDDVPFRELSVVDAAALADVAREHRPDVVLHLAAQIDVRRSVADPAADALVNVVGTIAVLEAARAVDAKVVFVSTGGAIYGADVVVPTPEHAVAEPEAPYGAAKLAAEHYLALYGRLHGTRHVALRLGNVYGPRQDPSGEAGVVAIFAGAVARGDRPTIYGDGKQTRDYTYVGDAVGAMARAADTDAAGTWNVGTGVETTVLDLLRHTADAAGRAVEPRFAPARAGELARSALDPSRAAAELGWRATTPVADGVRRVHEWVVAGSPPRARA